MFKKIISYLDKKIYKYIIFHNLYQHLEIRINVLKSQILYVF